MVLRKEESYPILIQFEKWLMDASREVLKSSRLGKVISYTYTIFPKLSRYHIDGRYRIDNNSVENAILPLAIGRKLSILWKPSGNSKGFYYILYTGKQQSNGCESA